MSERLDNRPFRILVGTTDIGGHLGEYADAFRRMGHEVTTVVYQRNAYHPEARYDVCLSRTDTSGIPSIVSKRSRSSLFRLPKAAFEFAPNLPVLLDLARRHDLFLFQFGGTSLLPGNREYPLLKRMGKKIVSIFNGSDIRYLPAYEQQYGIAASGFPEHYRNQPLGRVLRNLRMGEAYADVLLAAPNSAGLAVRPYRHYYQPLDLSQCENRIPGREIPVIVHAPSNKGVKGTERILAALDQLRAEGVEFHLRLLEGVAHREVLAALADADIAIDQLMFYMYGTFSIEAMASGCAVATQTSEVHEPIPSGRPIWPIDSNQIVEQLRRLITDRALRIRLAAEGRSFVERTHDHRVVARRILDWLETGALHAGDHYPSFFAYDFRLPERSAVPADLRRLTMRVIRRWGLPHDADPGDMARRGLISKADIALLDCTVRRWGRLESFEARRSPPPGSFAIGPAGPHGVESTQS